MAMIVVAACFAWPTTIAVGEAGVQRHVWWRPTLTIPWNEVSGIEKTAGNDIHVFGDHGQCVNFTRFHVDPVGFQSEVLRRAKLKRVIDASAPPSLRL
jgi:hypothetical protein